MIDDDRAAVPPPPALAPLGLGALLDAAFDVVRGHAAVLVGLGALLYVPLAFASQPLEEAADAEPAFVWIAVVLASLVASPVVLGAATHTAAVGYAGGSADAGSALASGLRRALALVGTGLLFGLLALLASAPLAAVAAGGDALPGAIRLAALAAGLVGLLVVALRFLLLTPVVVLEERGGRDALARAATLIGGQVLRCAGTLLVGGLLTGIVVGLGAASLGALPGIGPALAGLLQSLGFAYTTALTVVLYWDVRCRAGELAPGAASLPAPDPSADVE